MPFYLVTQTTLVEAEDDGMAAQKAVDQVRAADLIKVIVKIDGTITTHVIEPAALADARVTTGYSHEQEDEPTPTIAEEEPATHSLLSRFSTWLTSRPNSR